MVQRIRLLFSQLTESLKALSRQEGVTLYITLIAAFQTLLHRYTGQDDLVIGTAVADRQQPEVQGLLGLFLNTVTLRTNFADNPTVQDLLTRVREVVLDAHAHQELPFERLVQELHLQRATGRSPLFQVSLSLILPLPSHWDNGLLPACLLIQPPPSLISLWNLTTILPGLLGTWNTALTSLMPPLSHGWLDTGKHYYRQWLMILLNPSLHSLC